MPIKNHLQFGLFRKPELQEATILYNAAGNEIERVYGNIAPSQFFSRTDIVRVVGGTTTKIIGNNAFQDCAFLLSVDFPSVTDIGNFAFISCIQLFSINFPTATTINNGAFLGCTQLSSLNIPAVITLQPAFFQCLSLPATLSFPYVTFFGNSTFFGAAGLTTIKLNCRPVDIASSAFSITGINLIRLRPAPNTPVGWTLGPGQTVGGRVVTVVADWTDWPN